MNCCLFVPSFLYLDKVYWLELNVKREKQFFNNSKVSLVDDVNLILKYSDVESSVNSFKIILISLVALISLYHVNLKYPAKWKEEVASLSNVIETAKYNFLLELI